jgi:phi LC3 family holin
MKINWKVRLKNKYFWFAAIPVLLLLIKQILELFGVSLDLSGIEGQLLDIVETVFIGLALAGVVVDPTTAGIFDSTLDAPKVGETSDDSGK